jgi:hypothetical protein
MKPQTQKEAKESIAGVKKIFRRVQVQWLFRILFWLEWPIAIAIKIWHDFSAHKCKCSFTRQIILIELTFVHPEE